MRKTVTCIIPFTTMQINPKGAIYLCCPAWTMQKPVGYLTDDQTLDDIWNNAQSQYIRTCVLNKNLSSICDTAFCPFAIKHTDDQLKTKDPRYMQLFNEIKTEKTELKTAPRTLLIAHSGRCNYRCIMCVSNEKYVKEDMHLNELIYKRELPRMLPRLSEIILSGDGDPFFMKDSRELMQKFDVHKYPNIKFSIITNGFLLNQAMWDSIKHNTFGWIGVSIDAATQKTYEYIRRGGRWDILKKNLQLIKKLCKQGRFESFTISFVVMKSNYKEMKQFVRMGIELGADRIQFQKIFGTSAVEENINITRNYEVFTEIANILRDPIFTHKSVDISLIQEYLKYKDTHPKKIQQTITTIMERFPYIIQKIEKIKNRTFPGKKNA